VSIAIVFISHAGLDAVPGGFGVTVFFFLSGYLITTLLRREFAINGDISLPKFYWRRAWRIFPPMYAALALGVVVSLVGLTPGTPTVPAVAAQALHFSNYASLTDLTNGIPLGTHVFWSLAVEEHFYLVFPICALFLLRRLSQPRQAAALLAACAVVLVWRMILVQVFDASVNRTFISTDTRIDAILFGCVLALHFNPMMDRGPKLSERQAVGAAVFSVAIIGLSMVLRNDFYRETIRYSVQSMALAPLFYAAIQRPDIAIFRVLNLRPVKFIGVLSYSLYLVHQIVILALRTQRPSFGVPEIMVVSGLISVAIAYGFHVLIEKPATQARKKYAAIPERGGRSENSSPTR
jgi:peptidoglycan/LPS O-acetylase OafA/YrhL